MVVVVEGVAAAKTRASTVKGVITTAATTNVVLVVTIEEMSTFAIAAIKAVASCSVLHSFVFLI